MQSPTLPRSRRARRWKFWVKVVGVPVLLCLIPLLWPDVRRFLGLSKNDAQPPAQSVTNQSSNQSNLSANGNANGNSLGSGNVTGNIVGNGNVVGNNNTVNVPSPKPKA